MALKDPMQGGGPPQEDRDPRLTRLYRAASGEEPPARLDAAILAAARREVGSRPRAVGSFLRAWRMPVAIAAVIVLSVSLVTLMMEEGGDPVSEAPPPVAPPAAEAPAPPSADAVKELRDAPSKQRAAVAPPPVAKPEPAPAPRVPVPGIRGLESKEAGMTAPAPARTDAPFPSAAQEQRQADDAAGRRALPQPEPASAPRADRESTPPAPARALSAPPPAAAPAEAARARSEAGALRSDRPLAGGLQKSALLSELEREPPEKWLERIEELRRQGEAAMAGELLAEFKRRFPNHPLPAGLR